MSIASLRRRPPASAYTDVLGRKWAVDKLDALIAAPDVYPTVLAGVSQGLEPNHTWCPARVLGWARLRYTRESSAALLLLLVTRYFDTAGAHYLKREMVG